MPSTYADAVQHLLWLGHEGRALKWDLANIGALLDRLGHPEQQFASVHLAGTNGKGSVAAMLEAILRAAGCRTGLYTSPHLVRINERIRVAGADISDADFAAAFSAVEQEIEALLASGTLPVYPSYFETLTAMAFWHFRQAGVEVAVLEVGMGGRLDATNVVTPLASVLTPIDFDHERYLGHRLEQIAAEKAGIIKPGVPVVSAVVAPAAQAVVRERARLLDAPLVEIDAAYQVEALGPTADGYYAFDLAAGDGFRLRLAPGLRGRFQVGNAATAAAAARLLAERGLRIRPEHIAEGIAGVCWPGRLERIAQAPNVFLDGGHNPAAIRELAAFWDEHCRDRPVHLVFAAMRDKAVAEIADLLFPRAASVTLTQVNSARAASAALLARLAQPLNPAVFVEPNPLRALAHARELAAPDDVVFVTGSLYLVGEIRRALDLAAPAPAPPARETAATPVAR